MLHFQQKFIEQGGHYELLPFKLGELKRCFLLGYKFPPKDPEMGLPKLQAAPWLLLTLKQMQRKENKCSLYVCCKKP